VLLLLPQLPLPQVVFSNLIARTQGRSLAAVQQPRHLSYAVTLHTCLLPLLVLLPLLLLLLL
jgi:hypothetical protein